MDFNEASEYLRLSSQELEEERINQALSRMDSLGNLEENSIAGYLQLSDRIHNGTIATLKMNMNTRRSEFQNSHDFTLFLEAKTQDKYKELINYYSLLIADVRQATETASFLDSKHREKYLCEDREVRRIPSSLKSFLQVYNNNNNKDDENNRISKDHEKKKNRMSEIHASIEQELNSDISVESIRKLLEFGSEDRKSNLQYLLMQDISQKYNKIFMSDYDGLHNNNNNNNSSSSNSNVDVASSPVSNSHSSSSSSTTTTTTTTTNKNNIYNNNDSNKSNNNGGSGNSSDIVSIKGYRLSNPLTYDPKIRKCFDNLEDTLHRQRLRYTEYRQKYQDEVYNARLKNTKTEVLTSINSHYDWLKESMISLEESYIDLSEAILKEILKLRDEIIDKRNQARLEGACIWQKVSNNTVLLNNKNDENIDDSSENNSNSNKKYGRRLSAGEILRADLSRKLEAARKKQRHGGAVISSSKEIGQGRGSTTGIIRSRISPVFLNNINGNYKQHDDTLTDNNNNNNSQNMGSSSMYRPRISVKDLGQVDKEAHLRWHVNIPDRGGNVSGIGGPTKSKTPRNSVEFVDTNNDDKNKISVGSRESMVDIESDPQTSLPSSESLQKSRIGYRGSVLDILQRYYNSIRQGHHDKIEHPKHSMDPRYVSAIRRMLPRYDASKATLNLPLSPSSPSSPSFSPTIDVEEGEGEATSVSADTDINSVNDNNQGNEEINGIHDINHTPFIPPSSTHVGSWLCSRCARSGMSIRDTITTLLFVLIGDSNGSDDVNVKELLSRAVNVEEIDDSPDNDRNLSVSKFSVLSNSNNTNTNNRNRITSSKKKLNEMEIEMQIDNIIREYEENSENKRNSSRYSKLFPKVEEDDSDDDDDDSDDDDVDDNEHNNLDSLVHLKIPTSTRSSGSIRNFNNNNSGSRPSTTTSQASSTQSSTLSSYIYPSDADTPTTVQHMDREENETQQEVDVSIDSSHTLIDSPMNSNYYNNEHTDINGVDGVYVRTVDSDDEH